MSAEPPVVLVLGVGGNVSQGIVKALRIARPACRIIGACVSPTSAFLHVVDAAELSPPANATDFGEWLSTVCRKHRVAAVLSGVEPVLHRLAALASGLRCETRAVCLVSQPEALEIGADKWKTAQWLRQEGFAAPATALLDQCDEVAALVAQVGFPVVLKPRCGKGSEGIRVVYSPAELAAQGRLVDYVAQEYLGDPANEYTASTYSDPDGRVRGVMVMRRRLAHGTSVDVEAGAFPEVRKAAGAIASALSPVGPLNAQFRLRRGQPVCFELNVRFSGTTPIRARLGFNDVEAAIRQFVLGWPAYDLPNVVRGRAIRYWNEVYPQPAQVEALEGTGYLEQPGGTIENCGT